MTGTAARRRPWRIPRLVVGAVATAVVLGAGVLVTALSGPAPTLIGEPAPPLYGEDLHGHPQDLADRQGDVVVVNVWASWCPPCEKEIPVLLEAQRRYAGDGLVILGIATQDNPSRALDAAGRWGADAYVSLRDEDGALAVAWGTRGVPETFVVDRDGNVVDRHIGPVDAAWVEARLEPVVRP